MSDSDALLNAAWIAGFGADTADLPICLGEGGPLSASQLRQWALARPREPAYLVIDEVAEDVSSVDMESLTPAAHTLILLQGSYTVGWGIGEADEGEGGTLEERVSAVLSEVWGAVELQGDYWEPQSPRLIGTGVSGNVSSAYYRIAVPA